MYEFPALKFPVKSIARAKIFYEEFLKREISINVKIGSKIAVIKSRDTLKSIGYLYEEKAPFIPDTFFMVHEFNEAKDINERLKKVKEFGGEILFYQQQNAHMHYQVLIKDSEGNRIIIMFNKKSLFEANENSLMCVNN